MKKHMLILFTALLVLALFAGCMRREVPAPTTPSTRPLATIPPETRPVPSVDPDNTVDATIEDGNGPIQGQTETSETAESTGNERIR